MKYYILDYVSTSKGESGESCKSLYNLDDACDNCGTGSKLIGNLITKRTPKFNCDFFATLDCDFLVSTDLFNFLIDKEIKIKTLKKAYDTKKKETIFYHLYTEKSFPKSLPTSKGLIIERQCPICKRNGYFSDVKIGDNRKGISTIITPVKLIYENIEKDFLESSDLFITWEHLGLSNIKAEAMKVIRYARPMLIISEKVKIAFEEYKVKDAKFEEIIML